MNALVREIEARGYTMRGGRLVCGNTGAQIEPSRDPSRSSSVIVHMPGRGTLCSCSDCEDARQRSPDFHCDYYHRSLQTASSMFGWLRRPWRTQLETDCCASVLLLLATTGESRFLDVFDVMKAREQPAEPPAAQ